ncbi:pentapeptide repeat-containing protein [uncultured Methylobacterium sp.]|uniref:pentapeptide repeat-containing protein n=1 Tax=uncultured Methylobacterium sp. TaxID=157278 RepID=UPI0035CB22E5
MMRGLAAGLCALVLAATSARAAPRSGPAECRPAAAREEVLEAVGPRGEIVLGSGARAVLGSLRWPDDPDAAKAATDWLMAHRGRRLTVVARGEPDRWGRGRIDATAEAEDRTVDLAGGLIGAGLALADAGEGDALCRPALLAVEETARAGTLGLWRRPVTEAGDGAALREAAGRFVVVRGIVRHVGERPARTYLDFVAQGADGLTVTVSKRTWRRMLEHGLSADRLRGRPVRVRGVVEVRRGASLDVVVPEMIEVLEEPPTAASGAGTDRERALRR